MDYREFKDAGKMPAGPALGHRIGKLRGCRCTVQRNTISKKLVIPTPNDWISGRIHVITALYNHCEKMI